ncbi:hypothetical protein OG625_13910 [Streptomyces sp. NBC_01351]|uniref:hypothetical protein n=1 Tax=Streptomyces sp. NBC_01351 TaxID=2903833 RepID=UPI002E3006E8|nr:hypothetical protein [Streptomyces sp. NBC_01351]
MEHLLSITASEPYGGRWLPLDEDPAESIGHGMDMGDLGGMYFFVCRACPGTPYAHRYDC